MNSLFRGWETIKFIPKLGFQAKSLNSSLTHEEIDLSEGDWTSWDDDAVFFFSVFVICLGLFAWNIQFLK
jgi:hypothetical protein